MKKHFHVLTKRSATVIGGGKEVVHEDYSYKQLNGKVHGTWQLVRSYAAQQIRRRSRSWSISDHLLEQHAFQTCFQLFR